MSIVYHLTSVIFLSSFTALHPIHLAISEINYSEKEQSLQIMHKIFYDDLEEHIEREEKNAGREVNLQLGSEKEHPKADDYIRKYVQRHFTLIANGKTYSGTYLGKEYETDALWIYLEVEKVKRPQQLDIGNTFLIPFHEDQHNFVHFNIAGQKKSLRFYKGKERQQIVF